MGDFKSIITSEKKNYPKDPELWIEFYDDITTGIAKEASIVDLTNREAQVNIGMKLAYSVIKDWNFGDSNGDKLEVSLENIDLLPSSIMEWIVAESEDILNKKSDKKKQLNS